MNNNKGSNDLFVKYGDIDSLAEKIKEILKKEHNREDISRSAKERFDRYVMADKYLKLYKEILGQNKKRILYIDVVCKYGSTGKIVYDLCHVMHERGYDAAVCYGRGEDIKERDIYKFGLDWETNIHAGLARLTGFNGFFSPISTKRLINFIEYYKPDLIHIHELHAYFVNICPLLDYIKKKHIKLVWTFHCEYMYTGKCGHAFECNQWMSECVKCLDLKGYPKSLFLDQTKHMFRIKKRLMRDLDVTIVTPSLWLASRVKKSFLRDKQVLVINNGIDTTVFSPKESNTLREELSIPRDYKIVISVAPDIMHGIKGGQWILKLSDKMRNEKVFFVLVGTERNKRYSNVIEIKKIKDQETISAFYSLADLFVICSKIEVFPTTCIEAQCCGTPIAGFDVGGVNETYIGYSYK